MKRYSFLLLIAIIILGACLRLYRLSETNILPGDAERDLFIARDIILYHQYPLIGPPTSLGWLYLSPAIYYLWATILYIGRLNSIFPAIFTILLDTTAIYFFYKLGKLGFDEKTGILSALFYASSPYLIIHSRVPLHVNLMPLFVVLFYLFLISYLLYDKGKYYFLCWVSLGILLQLHATAIILLFVLLFFSYRKKCWRMLNIGFVIFIAIISPWWITDIVSNNFFTIGKFAAWIPYRIGSALGFFTSKNIITISRLKEAIEIVVTTLGNIIFVPQKYIALIIFSVCIFFSFIKTNKIFYYSGKEKKTLGFINTIFIIIFISLLVHGQPNEQYFISLVPIVILLIGNFLSKNNIAIIIALFIIVDNIIFMLTHNNYL